MNTFDGEVSEDSVNEKQRSVEVSSNREYLMDSINLRTFAAVGRHTSCHSYSALSSLMRQGSNWLMSGFLRGFSPHYEFHVERNLFSLDVQRYSI